MAERSDLRDEVVRVVHDLRGTLSNLASFADLLPRAMGDVELNEKAAMMLERLAVNARRAAVELEALRDLVRDDEG